SHTRWRAGMGQASTKTTRATIFAIVKSATRIPLLGDAAFARFVCRLLVGAVCVVSAALAQQAQHPRPAQVPAQTEEIYAQGLSALKEGNLPAAKIAFEKVVKAAPNSAEAHNSLGWVLLAAGQPDPAVAQFRIATKLKPELVQAHINLANAL